MPRQKNTRNYRKTTIKFKESFFMNKNKNMTVGMVDSKEIRWKYIGKGVEEVEKNKE